MDGLAERCRVRPRFSSSRRITPLLMSCNTHGMTMALLLVSVACIKLIVDSSKWMHAKEVVVLPEHRDCGLSFYFVPPARSDRE